MIDHDLIRAFHKRLIPCLILRLIIFVIRDLIGSLRSLLNIVEHPVAVAVQLIWKFLPVHTFRNIFIPGPHITRLYIRVAVRLILIQGKRPEFPACVIVGSLRPNDTIIIKGKRRKFSEFPLQLPGRRVISIYDRLHTCHIGIGITDNELLHAIPVNIRDGEFIVPHLPETRVKL